jgi:predicted lipoprotein with Yx(FWY)xxD motif
MLNSPHAAAVFAAFSSVALFGTVSGAAPADTPVPAPTPAAVQIVDTPSGQVVADAQGLSLYVFDKDTTSASTCYGACANAWPAALAPADPPAAPLGITMRNDGKKQLTLKGRPLYRFAGDAAQGDTNGDGLGGIWHLARPTQAFSVELFAPTPGASASAFTAKVLVATLGSEPAPFDTLSCEEGTDSEASTLWNCTSTKNSFFVHFTLGATAGTGQGGLVFDPNPNSGKPVTAMTCTLTLPDGSFPETGPAARCIEASH